MLAAEILGLPIPDTGPIFAAALAAHVACGLTAVAAADAPDANHRTADHQGRRRRAHRRGAGQIGEAFWTYWRTLF